MSQVAARLGELDARRETVVICRSGNRSVQVARLLEREGFRSVANLSGGILAWSREVDPSIPELLNTNGLRVSEVSCRQ